MSGPLDESRHPLLRVAEDGTQTYIPVSTDTPRCGAAHDDDPSPCDSPPDSVRIVDRTGGEALGCLRHGAALLASLEGARVYPATGSAIEAYRRARTMKPFEFELWLRQGGAS